MMKEFYESLISYIRNNRKYGQPNTLTDRTSQAIVSAFSSLKVIEEDNDKVVVSWVVSFKSPSPKKPDRICEIKHDIAFSMRHATLFPLPKEGEPKTIVAYVHRSGANCYEPVYNEINAINLIQAQVYQSAFNALLLEPEEEKELA